MQTQCPFCKTQFRLTETQLALADGLVRCGVCTEVFNALEAQQSETQDKTNQTTSPVTESTIDSLIKAQPYNTDNFTGDLIATPLNPAEVITAFPPDDYENKSETTRIEEEFDLFKTDDDDPHDNTSNIVIPDRFRNTGNHHSTSTLSSLLWSLAIVLLAFTLAAEYAWFNRNTLVQLPQASAWIKRFCKQFSCEWVGLRDPSKIELLSRKVTSSQPDKKQALMVSVTLVNHASYAQPWPDIQLDFSNVRGKIIAARRFSPTDYLHTAKNKPQLLPPAQPENFTMELHDPGQSAMTYEFNFL